MVISLFSCQDILKLLKKTVPASHPKYPDCILAKPLFETFRLQDNVYELIRLYTLETPLYDTLQKNIDSFAIELYSHLSSL